MPAVNRYYSSTAVDTTLTGPITNVATSMVVASVSGWPTSYPYTVILDEATATEEVVSVTAAAGTTLTISRAQDGTSGVAHSTGATARHGVSARDFTEPQAHIAGNSGVHGVTGNVVGATDTQTLTNKDLTSGTNTFPTSLATLTTAQALTHKDLTDATNTFPSTLVATSGNQSVAGNKTFTGNDTFTGGSGATPSLIIAPTTDTYALKIVRGTDTSPTQPLLQIRDHADTSNVFACDAVGNVVAGTKIQSFLADTTRATLGNFFGGNDLVTLNVKRGTDTSPTQDIVQITNQAGTSTFFKVDANGTAINKIPAQAVSVTSNVGSIQGTEVTLATASAFTPDGVTKVKVGFSFFGVSCTNAGETWEMRIKDSVAGQIGAIRVINVNASSTEQGGQFETVYTPSAASHTLTVVMVRIAGTGTGTLAASANAPATLIIQQLF